MKYDDLTIQKLRELSILEVAEKLGFNLKGLGDEGRRALCPYHDDQHPSLHFSKKKGIFKCFVCGAKGDLFKLVMDDRNCTFPEACEWLINEFHVVVVTNTIATPHSQGENLSDKTDKKTSVKSVSSVVPLDPTLVSRSLSVDSVFCQSAVSAGYLSQSQLRHAANRYCLGTTKDGGVIFWQIDDLQRVHSGKVMYYQPDCHRSKGHHPTWVHCLIKDQLPPDFTFQPCLFGLHLLSKTIATPHSQGENLSDRTNKKESVKSVSSVVKNPSVVCIVESEKSAVILSEKFPDFVWLSCGGLQSFKPELLAPLVNHKIVVFPDTDETGEAYKQWLAVLQQAQRQYAFKYPLRISNLLEQHASFEQKSRKIDIVDFLFEVTQKLA